MCAPPDKRRHEDYFEGKFNSKSRVESDPGSSLVTEWVEMLFTEEEGGGLMKSLWELWHLLCLWDLRVEYQLVVGYFHMYQLFSIPFPRHLRYAATFLCPALCTWGLMSMAKPVGGIAGGVPSPPGQPWFGQCLNSFLEVPPLLELLSSCTVSFPSPLQAGVMAPQCC